MNYKDVKIAVLEHTIRKREADDALAHVLATNGLDPKKLWKLNDKDETITEVIADGAQSG